MQPISDLLNMSNAALFTILIAALVTILTSLFTFYHWSALTKQIVCVVISLVCSGVYILIESDTWHTYVRMALLVFVGATLFYHLLKPGMQELNAQTTPATTTKAPNQTV